VRGLRDTKAPIEKGVRVPPPLSYPLFVDTKKSPAPNRVSDWETGQMGLSKAPYTRVFRLVTGNGAGWSQPRTLKKGGVWSVDTKKTPRPPLGRQGVKLTECSMRADGRKTKRKNPPPLSLQTLSEYTG